MLTCQVGDYLLPGHFKLVYHHLHTLQRERSWCTGAHGSNILQDVTLPLKMHQLHLTSQSASPWDSRAAWGPTWGTLAMCCRSVRSVSGTAPSPGSICSFTRWLVTNAQMALVLPGTSRQ